MTIKPEILRGALILGSFMETIWELLDVSRPGYIAPKYPPRVPPTMASSSLSSASSSSLTSAIGFPTTKKAYVKDDMKAMEDRNKEMLNNKSL